MSFDSTDSIRDPDAVAFEKTYPGTRAVKVEIGPQSFDFTAHAPPDVLVQVGLVTQAMLDAIPPCGQGSFGPKPRLPKNYAPLNTQLYRKKSGEIQVRQWAWQDATLTMAFRAKLGMPVPAEEATREANADVYMDGVRQATAEMKGAGAKRFLDRIGRSISLRERQIGRRQLPQRWGTCGNVIYVDWSNVRGAAILARLP